MRRCKRFLPAMLAACLAVLIGCTGETKRMDPDQMSNEDYGTGLTSQDYRSVCDRMARSLVQLEQIQNAKEPPKIAFAPLKNDSNDFIDGDAFLGKMRTELIKNCGGRIVFLDRELIERIDKENRDKARGKRTTSGEETPLGADFFLTGTVNSIDRVAGSGRTQYLRLSFRLTGAGNSAVVWEDEYEIKKHATTGLMYR